MVGALVDCGRGGDEGAGLPGYSSIPAVDRVGDIGASKAQQ